MTADQVPWIYPGKIRFWISVCHCGDCAVCHGLPGQAESAVGKGEFPKPPQLFQGKGVSDDPPRETFLEGGERYPADRDARIPGALSDEQMWQISPIQGLPFWCGTSTLTR